MQSILSIWVLYVFIELHHLHSFFCENPDVIKVSYACVSVVVFQHAPLLFHSGPIIQLHGVETRCYCLFKALFNYDTHPTDV